MTSIPLTNGHGPQIGDDCPRALCSGTLKADRRNGVAFPDHNVRVEQLFCWKCNCRPLAAFRVVPLKWADRSDELAKVFRRDVPICPVHNVKMKSYGTKAPITYYKCQCEDCKQTSQSIARVV